MQMDIYDLLTPEDLTAVNFRTMTIEEIADTLGRRLGLEFKFNGFFGEYQTRIRNRVLSVKLRHYSETGEPFISCHWQEQKGSMEGCGCPCDSLASAYTFLHRAKEGAGV